MKLHSHTHKFYLYRQQRLWLCLETSAYISILRKAKENEKQMKFGQYSDANRHTHTRLQKVRRWGRRGRKGEQQTRRNGIQKNWLHSISAHMFRVWELLNSPRICWYFDICVWLSFTHSHTCTHTSIQHRSSSSNRGDFTLYVYTLVHHIAVSVPQFLALAQWRDVNDGTILQYPNIHLT